MYLTRSCFRLFFFCLPFVFISFNNSVAQNAVPRFETAECPVPAPESEKKFECGYLIVSESRKTNDGKIIRLPIIILKSENPNPQPDPILRTFGGPGASSLRMIRSRRFSPWLKNRDVIIFEQRGTRYAQPALECPEINKANIKSVKQQLDSKKARKNEVQAAKLCYDRLLKQDINLAAYNSAESAADIADLRRVLKLEKLNLYGLSYSSRLMLNVMRDFPEGIRSVVLESSLPPEVNYDEVGVDGIVYSLNVLFANCQADADCAKAFPALETEFYAAVRKLNKDPFSVSVKDEKTGETTAIKLNGHDFATWVVDYMFSNEPEAIVTAPFSIHQVFLGNYDSFKKYADDKINPSSYAWGMRFSVWCSEEFPFEDPKKITAQSFRYPKLYGYEVMALPDICSVWKVPPAAPVENKPIKSDIPALVLNAEYDAYTPSAWGEGIANNLINSFVFEVPWAGHGPAFSVPCAREMISDFFDKPQTAPNSECLDKIKSQYKFVVKKP